jgi:pimeloyl-ACP methyl ester carboxylesterase
MRCDRFARVLAHCGFIVMCPRLSALTQMRLDATAIDELSRSLEALTALPEHPRRKRPGIFSISFGSYPALMTAASPHVGHLVGSLIVFGGYGSFVDTCRFMIGASPADARAPAPDPTCMAGLAINTAAALFDGEQKHWLIHAWRAFVARVWGASDMQHEQIAEAANEIAADLPPEIRPMFLQGCGLVPGFGAWVEEGLARTDVQTMDARAHLHNVRCPVHLFHGRRDNVIPHSQMTVLANALSSVDPKTYLTGLYEHGRSDANALRQIPTLLREIATMAAMVHAMVLSGTRSA